MRYALLILLLIPAVSFAATPTVGTTNYAESATAAESAIVSAPSGLGSGDLCLVFVLSDQNNPGAGQHDPSPADLTYMGQVASNTADVNVSAYYWTGGSPPATFRVDIDSTGAGTARYMIWAIEVLNPHASPEDFTTAGTAATGNSLAIPGQTTNNDSVLAFFIGGFDGPDGGPIDGISGTGWSQNAEDETGTGGNGLAGVWGTKPIHTTAATGTITIDWAGTVSDGYAGLQVGIRGADPGGAADQYEGTVIIIQ